MAAVEDETESNDPIKNFASAAIENALAKALTDLTGTKYRVHIKRVDYEPQDVRSFDRVRLQPVDIDLRASVVEEPYDFEEGK